MARKPAAIPGAASDPADLPAEVVKPLPEDTRALSMGLPDFRDKSCAYAMQWFADNPDAPKRNVLTAEGWYVHPLPPGANNAARPKG